MVVRMARTLLTPTTPASRVANGIARLAAGLAMASIVAGCGDERSAGASTETTNGFSGQAVESDGQPAVGARVRVWDPRGDHLLGQAISGADGRWTVAGIESPVVGIEVATSDRVEGAWSGGHRTIQDSAVPLVVRTSAHTSLAMVDQKLSRLAGTPWRTTDGVFRSVPSGSFTVLSDTSSRSFPVGSIRLVPAIPGSMVSSGDPGLLVEDFDDGDSTWVYGPIRDNSARWFTQVSPSGAALLKPLSAESTATPGMVETGAFRGRSLRMRYFAADTGSFVQAGIYFRGVIDLSALRAIRIKAKGDGVLRLGLWGHGAGGTRALWQASPDSAWREYVFRPGSEMQSGPQDPPLTSFDAIKPRVFLLMIQAYGGSDLWVDDIRFDGITPETVMP